MDPSILLNHPALKNISPEKLSFFTELTKQGKTKGMKDMVPFLLAASSSSKKKGLDFTSSEMNLIMEIMKQNMHPDEIKQMDFLISSMEKMKK